MLGGFCPDMGSLFMYHVPPVARRIRSRNLKRIVYVTSNAGCVKRSMLTRALRQKYWSGFIGVLQIMPIGTMLFFPLRKLYGAKGFLFRELTACWNFAANTPLIQTRF